MMRMQRKKKKKAIGEEERVSEVFFLFEWMTRVALLEHEKNEDWEEEEEKAEE